MKNLIALAIMAIAAQALDGEPVVSSKQVVAPPPSSPPEYFRPIGAFGTYAKRVGSGENAGRLHGWGGGIDLTYWFPWKYAGVRFQGAGRAEAFLADTKHPQFDCLVLDIQA